MILVNSTTKFYVRVRIQVKTAKNRWFGLAFSRESQFLRTYTNSKYFKENKKKETKPKDTLFEKTSSK